MRDARWWLVCYDVHDPKRLRKAAKHLEGYGERLQWSVFRCWLTKLQMEQLRWELTELLDPVDEVMLIPLCTSCVDQIKSLDLAQTVPEWSEKPARHKII